ncbi:unnamed protein product [Ixodes pacificus]
MSSAKASAGHKLDTAIASKFGSNLTRSRAPTQHSSPVCVQCCPSLVTAKIVSTTALSSRRCWCSPGSWKREEGKTLLLPKHSFVCPGRCFDRCQLLIP